MIDFMMIKFFGKISQSRKMANSKPHIYKDVDCWRCIGLHFIGYGESPDKAYDDWLKYRNLCILDELTPRIRKLQDNQYKKV